MRGSGYCGWGRLGDMPPVFLSAGRDAVIEGDQGRDALFFCLAVIVLRFGFWYCPPFSSPIGSQFTVGLGVAPLFSIHGQDLDVQID